MPLAKSARTSEANRKMFDEITDELVLSGSLEPKKQ
jgi:hypothetical protein